MSVLLGFSGAIAIWSIPIALGIAAAALDSHDFLSSDDSSPIRAAAALTSSPKTTSDKWRALIAGAALLIDYILTVSVSVTSGVENIASAFPMLNEHKELFCAAVIFVIMMLNLRGIRESSTIFAFPTYFFIFQSF